MNEDHHTEPWSKCYSTQVGQTNIIAANGEWVGLLPNKLADRIVQAINAKGNLEFELRDRVSKALEFVAKSHGAFDQMTADFSWEFQHGKGAYLDGHGRTHLEAVEDSMRKWEEEEGDK